MELVREEDGTLEDHGMSGRGYVEIRTHAVLMVFDQVPELTEIFQAKLQFRCLPRRYRYCHHRSHRAVVSVNFRFGTMSIHRTSSLTLDQKPLLT